MSIKSEIFMHDVGEFSIKIENYALRDEGQHRDELTIKDGTYQYICISREEWRELRKFVDEIWPEPIIITQVYEIAERKPESPTEARFKEILRHTLGLDYQAKPFRNRYITGVNCDSYPVLLEMEKAGLVARARTPMFLHKDDVIFYATDKGFEFVGATKEERDL